LLALPSLLDLFSPLSPPHLASSSIDDDHGLHSHLQPRVRKRENEATAHSQSRQLIEVDPSAAAHLVDSDRHRIGVGLEVSGGLHCTAGRLDRDMESLPSAISQCRQEVDQLRREAAIKRIPASQAIEDIKRYTIDHVMQDHLIIGFPSEKANPYREQTWRCQVL